MGKTYPAVEESYPAVGAFFHGILFFPARAPLYRPAAPQKNRCYVKKYTDDVIFFTFAVKFFT